jgi:hypothetical protein
LQIRAKHHLICIGVNIQDVSNFLFGNGGGSLPGGLAGFYDFCSYGVASVSPSTTTILGPVIMPCNGSSAFGPWSVNTCTALDYYGWQLWLASWTALNYPNLNMANYAHRIILLPKDLTSFMLPSSECSFTGIGVVGTAVAANSYSTGVYSFVWLSGDYWNAPQSWMHEIGHNYFLRHSDIPPTEFNPVRLCSCFISRKWKDLVMSNALYL